MRSTTLIVALLCTGLAVPALAQGRGGGGAGDQGQGQGQGQGKGQSQVQGQGKSHGQGQSQDQSQGKGQGQNQGQNQGQGVGPGNAQAGQAQGPYVVPDRDRNSVQTYYRNEFAAGNCPPGLAKKNNGCLPPGQAKKMWTMGQPLPTSLVFYPLPGGLLNQLTAAPAGYQYVRVDNDVLLMITATRIIASVVANLGG